MSISQLVAAIDAVSRETRPEMRRSYMIAIKHGVKQIGDRLCAIEKRLDAVEQRRSEASVRAEQRERRADAHSEVLSLLFCALKI